jgi:hypothetical protein
VIQWNLENVTAVGDPSVTVSGSFDYNPSTEEFSNDSFTVSGLGAPFTLTPQNASGSALNSGYESFGLANTSIDEQVELNLGLNNGMFAGYLGKGPFPLISSLSFVVGDGQEFNLQGAISDGVAPTPLPAALPLFGTGLAVLSGARWLRRRKVRELP